MCECELRMKILLIFTLCLISGALGFREVTAYAGGRVNIKCKYEDGYKEKPKAFCKNGTVQWCFNNKRPQLISEWSHDGRFSVHDNRSAGLLRVFIRELVTEDTGTYMCAVAVSNEIQTNTVVKLDVRKDSFYGKSISETVHVGGDLNISCKYPVSITNKTKFLCKRLQTATCSHKVSVNNGNKLKKNKKTNREFFLYDDRERRILSVSIRNVTERDSGEYWCGAEDSWKSGDGYKVYFTQINLTVTGSTLKPATPSSSSSSTSSLSSSHFIPASPSAGFSASTVITVSVIVLLLLIGITLITLTLQKRRKIEGRASTVQCSVLNSGNNQEVPLTVCEYEEIKDTSCLYASERETSAVYSTVQLPTIPSDQDIYFTTLLPTGQSAGKPAEGLTYTALSFHTNATSPNDAVPKIREDYADYASVSHVTSSD